MKTRLLKRLRRKGWNMIVVFSVTTTNGRVTGMEYGYNSGYYRNLFLIGDTEEDVRNKAMKIYMEKEVKRLKDKRDKK